MLPLVFEVGRLLSRTRHMRVHTKHGWMGLDGKQSDRRHKAVVVVSWMRKSEMSGSFLDLSSIFLADSAAREGTGRISTIILKRRLHARLPVIISGKARLPKQDWQPGKQGKEGKQGKARLLGEGR